MNASHDEHLDPLLAEALGPADEPRPELVGRICDLTDARLSAALDRAIGPDSVACDDAALVQRILAVTTDRPAVAGRIGFATGPLRSAARIAAVFLLAVAAYAVITAVTNPAPRPPAPTAVADKAAKNPITAPTVPTQTVAAIPDAPPVRASTLDALEREVALLAAAGDSPFDQRIALLTAGVNQMHGDAVWAESPDVLVDRVAERADWYDSSEGAFTPTWF